MSDTSVVVQMTAQDAELVAGWQRARRGVQEFATEVDKAGAKGKKAGQDVKAGMDEGTEGAKSLASSLTGIGSVLGGLTLAAQIFKSELDAIIQKQKEILGLQRGLEGPRRQVLQNLPKNSDLTPAQLVKQIQQGSTIPQGETWSAVQAALKAGGQTSQAAEIALAAGEMLPTASASERDQVAAAAVKMQAMQKGLGARQAIATIANAGQYSESGIGEIAGKLVPSLGRVGKLVPDSGANELMNLALAFEGQGDIGAAGGAKVLEKLFTKMDAVGVKGGNLDERLEKLRSDKKLQAKILPGFQENAGELVAVQGLIDPQGGTSKKFRELNADLGGNAAVALANFNSRQAAAEGVPKIAVATRGRAIENLVQRDIDSVPGARRGLADQALEAASKIAGPADALPGRVMRGGVGPIPGIRDAVGAFQSDERYTQSTVAEIRRISGGVADPEAKEKLDSIANLLLQQLEEMRSEKKAIDVRIIDDITPRPAGGPGRHPVKGFND